LNTNIEEEEGGVNHTLHPIRTTTTKQGSTKPVMLGFSLMGVGSLLQREDVLL